MRLPKIILTLSAALLLTAAYPSQSNAWSFSIFGNGKDSTNRIRVNRSSNFNFKQSNSFSSFTTIKSSHSTGGNTASGNTNGNVSVKSGSSYSFVSVSNTGSSNHFSGDLCCDDGKDCDNEPTPTPKPSTTPNPSPSTTPSPSPTPPPSCQETTIWAQSVEASDQGDLNSGDPVTDTDRTNPDAALGTPDGDFFSLGFGGTLTIKFQNPVANVSGTDLSFHEITEGRDTYPQEKAQVEVSDDGSTWHTLSSEVSNKASDDGPGVTLLDFNETGLSEISYVRLTDTTESGIHDSTADGYDIDAIDAIELVCE